MTEPSGRDAVPALAACAHCGAAMEPGGDAYCCAGCAVAADIVRGAGLERWYAQRESPAPRPEPLRGAWSEVPVARDEQGAACTVLRVDGMTCASCAWLTERVLRAVPGIHAAQASLASGRVALRWDPARIDLERIAGRIAAIGYRPRPSGDAGAPDRELLVRAGVAAFLAANVMLASAALYAGWFDAMEPRYAALFRWVTLVLATPLVAWCAQPFLAGAWRGVRHGVLHVDLPVSVGILAMYGHGAWATLHGLDGWLDSLSMLVALLLAGRVLEQRGRRAAAEAASALAGSMPRTARRVVGGRIEAVAAHALVAGDVVEVGTGEEIPADGRVLRAERAFVRMAVLTGESAPVARSAGDPVVAGAWVEDGSLAFLVEAAGGETLLMRMSRGLADALDRPVPRELADRVAAAFTVGTLVLAGAALVGWGVTGGWAQGGTVAMAVLVVACPCALALAGPLATAVGLGAAARRGLLVRSGATLRRLEDVTTVVLDKTGTLTGGVPAVVSADDAVLRIAAGLERASAHPIARAILREAAARGIPLPVAQQVHETVGVGIRGIVDGRAVSLRAGAPGEVVLAAHAPDGRVARLGSVRFDDVLRPDARATVQRLRGATGAPREIVLLSGDHPDVATRIGVEAGVDRVIAGVDPEGKAAWVRAARAEGRTVLFVGDGVNDGLALAVADVGIAMGEGAAASIAIADAVVVGDGLGPLAAGFRVAGAVGRAVRDGTRRSLVYNALAVTAALAGLVNPLVAAVLMPLSSGMVAWRAVRVEREVA